MNRLLPLTGAIDNKELVEAKLGGVSTPSISLSKALEMYFDISTHLIYKKSEDQKRKWRNPRAKAIRNLIKVIGSDISLTELTRDHILALRDWWIFRISEEDMVGKTANKDISFAKTIISGVNDHMKLGLDTEHFFSKMQLPESQESRRKPFKNDFIQNELLNQSYHENLIEEAKYLLYAFADTGAGFSELIGLRPEDIFLDDKIPHIIIQPYKGRELKNKHRKRIIPLVGTALWAFQKCPNGFSHYRSMKSGSEAASATLMKHLRKHNLLPTEKHSVNSLRHSFQDRLTNFPFPERAQCQLMGHAFKARTTYGDGAYLKTLQQWLLKICFTPPEA